MTEWYNLSWSDVVEQLDSDGYNGLTEDKVEKLKKIYGKNVIPIPKGKNIFRTLVFQFKNFWILYMLVIISIYFYLGYINEGVTLLGIIMLNIILISFSENEREKEIIELQKLQSPFATVIRGGKMMKIPSEELVVGDIVIVNAGDIVPADIRIIEENNLKIKEGAVTGEGYIVEKYSTKIEERELQLTEVRNILFKSSAIIEGSSKGIVIATGEHTEISNIIGLILDNNSEGNMISKKLHSILNLFTVLAIIISAIFATLQLYVIEENIKNILYSFAWIPTTFIPFSIFIIIEIMAYFIIKSFKKKGIVFKNLAVMENLSKTNVVCGDKIGVFSRNTSYVDSIYVDDSILGAEELNINEESYKFHTLNRVINIGLMCNDTKFINGEYFNIKKDINEIAIIKFHNKNNTERFPPEFTENKIFTIPFDNERRLMTTINKIDGNYRANVKGAVDSLINRCTHLMKNGLEKEITEDDVKKIKYADIQMSRMGLNVVAFGYRNYSYEPSINENLESNLVFAGLIGFYNPPIDNIASIIKRGKSLNVNPIIFTEDNKLTAETFGKKIGLINRMTKVLSAVEMDNMPKEDLNKILGKIPIYSKIQARHKILIGKYFNDINYNTLMSGKRVTDLPYLRVSKVGMAIDGTNIVNNLSDVIISERNYESILDMIISSRKIINSIVNILCYIMVVSLTTTMINIVSTIMKFGYSLTTFGALWVSAITTIISSMILVFNYENEDEYISKTIDKNIFYGEILKAIFKAIVISGISIAGGYYNGSLPFLILNISLIILALNFNKKYTMRSKICLLLNIVVQLVYFVVSIKPNI